MNIHYKNNPVEGKRFSFSVSDTTGVCVFTAYLRGSRIWTAKCDDPPCHEEFRLPRNIAGETLLIEVRDAHDHEELVFFINDDGKGIPTKKPEAHVAF